MSYFNFSMRDITPLDMHVISVYKKSGQQIKICLTIVDHIRLTNHIVFNALDKARTSK